MHKAKEEYLYTTIYTMHSLKVLTHWSYSFTCKLHHDCLSVISVHQMVPPLTEVADIQLQLTTHLSTPYSLEWTVCCKASCKLYPRLIYIAQNAGPPNRGAPKPRGPRPVHVSPTLPPAMYIAEDVPALWFMSILSQHYSNLAYSAQVWDHRMTTFRCV